MSVKRLFTFANRYFFRRSLPHGIISWRYLLPYPPPKVRIHRHLWLAGRPPRFPVFLFFFSEFYLWLRWVIFACWRRSWRAVRRLGTVVSKREGFSKAVQFKRVLFLSLGYCISPAEIYAFGLYRHKPPKLWDYIFTQEVHAFHRWRSANSGDTSDSLALLQDKFRLTNLLNRHGIPMAPILCLVPCGSRFDPTSYLQTCPRLFCKPCHGSASRDAFVIEQQGDQGDNQPPAIFAVKGGMKAIPSTFDALRKAMNKNDFLVQPLLINHPKLAPLSPTEDAITLRIITERPSDSVTRCYLATLEIPGAADTRGRYHIIYPIEFSSGLIMPFPNHNIPAPVKAQHDAILARTSHDALPFWDEIRTSAIAAHQFLPGIYAIAWDYVITPTGPLMLEGNSGWGAATPQIIHGGLLAD